MNLITVPFLVEIGEGETVGSKVYSTVKIEDATSYSFGHHIFYDWNDLKWRYSDNKMPIELEVRKCPRCESYPTNDGHDPCSANIDGAISVCCGHGISTPILMWSS